VEKLEKTIVKAVPAP